jgi:hypothetical protein
MNGGCEPICGDGLVYKYYEECDSGLPLGNDM